MKIVFTGGGTGGHFYPIIAVAEKVNKIIDQEHIIGTKLYYISDGPYDKEMLVQNGLSYEEVKSGKMRTYHDVKSFFLNSGKQLPIQRAILDRLQHIGGADVRRACQVRQRAGDFQDAVMGAGGEIFCGGGIR